MTAINDLVNPETRMTIEPLHLSVTQTYSNGNSGNLHLLENGDLAIKNTAGAIFRSADTGGLVVALGVDGDHDEIHYQNGADADATETLRRAIEVLAAALEAVHRVTRAAT